MGLYTFILFMIIFGEILYAMEVTEKEYRRLSVFSGIGMIFDIIFWVIASVGTMVEFFTLYCWASFLYFTFTTGFLYNEIRKEIMPNCRKKE